MTAVRDDIKAEHAQRHGSPYLPSAGEWTEIYDMLCGHCAHHLRCEVVERMIEMRTLAEWPEGGWVWDRGGGTSCLSYQSKPIKRLPRQQLRRILRRKEANLPPVCGGCAARKGSEASTAHHTRVDFRNAVATSGTFICHETGGLCGGWCRAIRAKQTK